MAWQHLPLSTVAKRLNRSSAATLLSSIVGARLSITTATQSATARPIFSRISLFLRDSRIRFGCRLRHLHTPYNGLVFCRSRRALRTAADKVLALVLHRGSNSQAGLNVSRGRQTDIQTDLQRLEAGGGPHLVDQFTITTSGVHFNTIYNFFCVPIDDLSIVPSRLPFHSSPPNHKRSAYTLPHCTQHKQAEEKKKKKTNGKKSSIENSFLPSIWVEHQRNVSQYTVFEENH